MLLMAKCNNKKKKKKKKLYVFSPPLIKELL